MKKNSALVFTFYILVFAIIGCLAKKEVKNIIERVNVESPSDSVVYNYSDSLYNENVIDVDYNHNETEDMSVGASPTESNPKPITEKPKDIEVEPKSPLNIIDVTKDNALNNDLDKSGRVIYSIPNKMKYRNTYRVFLRIAKSKYTKAILNNVSGTVHSAVIPTTQTMEVKLIDPSPEDDKNFQIVSDNNAIQLVDSGETYTEWSWNVTPIRLVNSELKIVVSIIRDGNKKENVYEGEVEIQKDILTQINFFFRKYWQWILGTVIIPLIIFFYKKRKEKNNE